MNLRPGFVSSRLCILVSVVTLGFGVGLIGPQDAARAETADSAEIATPASAAPVNQSPASKPTSAPVLPLPPVPVGNSSAVVPIEACGSMLLRVELNANGSMNKTEMVRALKIFASFPQLGLTASRAISDVVAFRVTLPATCRDEATLKDCADKSGWSDLQWKLKPIKDVRIYCEPKPLVKETSVTPSVAAASVAEAKVVGFETLQQDSVRIASVFNGEGFVISPDEFITDSRIPMFSGVISARVLKEKVQKPDGQITYRKAIQLMGLNGEMFRLTGDENLESVRIEPSAGIDSVLVDATGEKVKGISIRFGGEKKIVVVLSVGAAGPAEAKDAKSKKAESNSDQDQVQGEEEKGD